MEKGFTITVNCLVKNEEFYVGYGIKSVIDFVDQVIVYDTGSTDETVNIINELVKQFPDKIIFEEKGICDKARHTQLRSEMLGRSNTDWIMILDGDEVWTAAGMVEAIETINKMGKNIDFLTNDIHLCVGDIFHEHNLALAEIFSGKKNLELSRFYRNNKDIDWRGDYGEDRISWGDDDFLSRNLSVNLKNKFWHMTHLRRSNADDADYTSNSHTETRKSKRRNTYFIIGKKIKDPIPGVFDKDFQIKNKLGFWASFINFWPYLFKRLMRKF